MREGLLKAAEVLDFNAKQWLEFHNMALTTGTSGAGNQSREECSAAEGVLRIMANVMRELAKETE